MKISKLLVAVTLFSLPAFATNYNPQPISTGTCIPHDTFGHPASGDMLLCRDSFEVGFDSKNKIPAWTAYRITQSSVDPICDKNPGFKADPYVPTHFQATNDDYKNNPWDKGHITPRATADVTCKAEVQSVYYTNAAPQLDKLNRYGWRMLEEEVRELANSMGEEPIYVVTGTIYSGNEKTPNGVAIPEMFYKVLYIPSLGQSIAFVFPNAPLKMSKKALSRGVMSVAAFESKYNLQPFKIPDSQKELVGDAFSIMYK